MVHHIREIAGSERIHRPAESVIQAVVFHTQLIEYIIMVFQVLIRAVFEKDQRQVVVDIYKSAVEADRPELMPTRDRVAATT